MAVPGAHMPLEVGLSCGGSVVKGRVRDGGKKEYPLQEAKENFRRVEKEPQAHI